MDKTPYLQVVDMPRMMAGEGAPRSTVFGVLGRTKDTGLTRSLGGLVVETTHGRVPKEAISSKKVSHNTEHHIIGVASKTPIPGAHYAQVPYAGAYMSHLGARLS